ncbi:O-antigen ligase family protein [Geobacter sp.]|uniref:O-antigen ligase family protein n=1 Tax=Geobacter sp. TaxID=46610 RepID=UPI00261C5F65|nr:O-antigen ligase family protein [Geobacter sp.]
MIVLSIILPFIAAVIFGFALPFLLVNIYHAITKWSDTTKTTIILWAISIGTILPIILTKRNLSLEAELFRPFSTGTAGFAFMTTRIATLLAIGVALVMLSRGLTTRRQSVVDSVSLLAWTFAIYFIGTVLVVSLGSEYPDFTYKYSYVLITIGSFFFLGQYNLYKVNCNVKTILFVVVLGSLIAIMVAPNLVLLKPYKGLIPGLNFRLFGITSHANTLGLVSLVLILLEVYFPSRRLLRIVILTASTVVFVLAQSKTAWVTLSGLVLGVYVPNLLVRYQIKQSCQRSIKLFVAVCMLMLAIISSVPFATDLEKFLHIHSDLTTFTGRTAIWKKTLMEWYNYPLFGYGPGIWGLEYRIKAGMLYAGQAHNQFIQTIGESGGIGLFLIVCYLMVLLQYAIRYYTQSKGLILSLWIIILFRCFSEAPLRPLVFIDWAFFIHALMIIYTVYYARSSESAPLGQY